jgi:hypothetical protein
MVRIALAVAAAFGLIFAANAADISQIGPLCQTPDGNLVVCHSWRGGAGQIGPLCQSPDGNLIVCHRQGGASQIGPLCQTPDGNLIVCHRG